MEPTAGAMSDLQEIGRDAVSIPFSMENGQRIDLLRRWAPFDALPESELRWLAERIEAHLIEPDAILMKPGDFPAQFLFIARGTLRIEAMGRASDERRVLAELSEGSCFPVEALHEDRPVFSTCRSVDEALLLVLSREDFVEFQSVSPAFQAFCEARSAILLEQSRQLYQGQFAFNRASYQSLDSPLAAIAEPDCATCAPETPVRMVVKTLAGHGGGTMVVVDEARRPLGVFNWRDLIEHLADDGYDPETPVAALMNHRPIILSGQALGYEAAMAMATHSTRHVLAVDGKGHLLGLVLERDLFALQKLGFTQISDAIRRAIDIGSAADRAADIRQLAHNLIEQGVGAEQLTHLVSTLNDQLAKRIIENELALCPGLKTVKFSWLVFGSEGRHEQTLSTDQDNGIAFAVPADLTTEEVRRRLLDFAGRVNHQLDRCGFPLCKGEVMASNPACCLSVDEWKERFRDWLTPASQQALLDATIYFDFRSLFGSPKLAHGLREWLAKAARGSTRLFPFLVQAALERSPPLGLIRDFVVDQNGSVDLKLSGVTLFVDAARILALASGVTATATHERLRQAGQQRRILEAEVEAWINGFHSLQQLRVRNQHEQHVQGGEMSNLVDPTRLDAIDRKILIESLRQAGKLQKRIETWFGGGSSM